MQNLPGRCETLAFPGSGCAGLLKLQELCAARGGGTRGEGGEQPGRFLIEPLHFVFDSAASDP